MYNFYIFLFIVTFIKPVSKFLLKNLFETLTIMEEIIASTFILLILFTFIFKFIYKGSFDKLINKFITNKNNILPKLVIYDIMIVTLIILSSSIILNEKIIYGESMKIALYIITISVITFIFNGGINLQFSIGLILIILGIYFVEIGNKQLK
tara:strand:- start:895 stop:1350 length:456 start_codon:yes stop_codon:yes gene_type:complete